MRGAFTIQPNEHIMNHYYSTTCWLGTGIKKRKSHSPWPQRALSLTEAWCGNKYSGTVTALTKQSPCLRPCPQDLLFPHPLIRRRTQCWSQQMFIQLLSSASPPSKALPDGFSSRTLSHCDVAHWVGPWWGYSGAERGRIQL